MTDQLGPGEAAWQLLQSGARVRVLRAVRPELVGATGVLGSRLRSNPVKPPARVLVRLSAPPEAVSAFPRGVFLPAADLAAAQDQEGAAERPEADDDDNEGDGADEDAGGDAREGLDAAARNQLEATRIAMATALGMTSTREWCAHGSPFGTAALGSCQQALVGAISAGAPRGDAAAMLRVARAFLAQRPGVASEALRRKCLAMALDTYGDDGPPFPAAMRGEIAQGLAAAALAVGEAIAPGGAAPADAARVAAAESLSSPLRVRRTLAAAAVCRCLHVCAAQGCGAKRARAEEAGADAASSARSARPLQQCSQCRAVYYCCSAHQREHWPSHKRECRELAAADAAAAASPGHA